MARLAAMADHHFPLFHITVKRSNLVQEGGLGSLVLQANDVLVLSTGDSFNVNNKDFTGNFNKYVSVEQWVGVVLTGYPVHVAVVLTGLW